MQRNKARFVKRGVLPWILDDEYLKRAYRMKKVVDDPCTSNMSKFLNERYLHSSRGWVYYIYISLSGCEFQADISFGGTFERTN